MKKIVYAAVLLLAFTFSACTIHIPYEWGSEYRDYRIILLVEPDDAEVLLDGKFIGEAYEFSNSSSAMRLHSRDHELVIRKKGYKEEVIDLYEYSTQNITIRLKLLEDKRYYSPKVERGERDKKREKPVFKPKTEPVKEFPAEEKAPPKPEPKMSTVVTVKLEIAPREAAIYLDGRFWGIVPEGGIIDNLRLKTGQYTLEVVKPGYKSYIKKLDVKDQDINLTIKLEK